MNKVRPFRCFDGKALPTSVGVAIWLVASALLQRQYGQWPDTTRLLATSQMLAVIGLVFVLVRSIARLDELERRIHLEAAATAGVLLITAIAGWSFMERTGLPSVDWSLLATPVFVIAWSLGVWWIGRKFV
ncbi:hypothetical protein [Solimonas terrae]|uniref:Uncharacterized protein n=1 Tax=Solimonas terrae TaxID=1396819 RepID=A0A6M2BMS8_9GAMM|nr:hypothetical protein [Solimonas terrae]NGY03738.1 hypothetical protein [Solimonas terrae]